MTTLVAIAFVAGLAFLGFGVLVWLWWQGRGSPHFVLGVLPIALLFFTQSMIPALRQILRGFEQIADTGTSTHRQIALMCLGVARPLWFAALAFLIALASAGFLQALTGRARRLATSVAEGRSVGTRWGGGVLIASSVLVIPVGVLMYRTMRLARVIMLVNDSSPSEQDAIARAFAGASIPLGEALGDQIVFSTRGAAALSNLLLAFAIANIFVIGFRKAPSLTRFSWLIFGIVCVAGGWALLQLGADIRWFAQAIR